MYGKWHIASKTKTTTSPISDYKWSARVQPRKSLSVVVSMVLVRTGTSWKSGTCFFLLKIHRVLELVNKSRACPSTWHSPIVWRRIWSGKNLRRSATRALRRVLMNVDGPDALHKSINIRVFMYFDSNSLLTWFNEVVCMFRQRLKCALMKICNFYFLNYRWLNISLNDFTFVIHKNLLL